MTEQNIHHIEETLAHQEQRIQDLSTMVTRQWAEIDRLKAQLAMMQDKVAGLAERVPSEEKGLSVSEIAALNKPPHW